MNNLAEGYRATGKLELALPLYEETLKLSKVKRGADHPDTLTSMNNLAEAYLDAKKLDLALPLLKETLRLRKVKLGADHPHTLSSMNNLAVGYRAAGKLDKALPLLEETFKLRKAKQGADHPDTLVSMNNLAMACQADGQLEQALRLFQEAAGFEQRRFQHEYACLPVINLIDCLEQLKRLDQAEVWRRKWLAVVKERSGADSGPYAAELVLLGLNLIQQRKWTDAETVYRQSLAIRPPKGYDSWGPYYARSMLGEALLGQQKYADAEPLLLAGYKGLKARANRIPVVHRALLLNEALERLVRLYEATGKKDEAARWRKELNAAKAGKEETKK
jgi:tetratricopeptide (TPR) repeat protein